MSNSDGDKSKVFFYLDQSGAGIRHGSATEVYCFTIGNSPTFGAKRAHTLFARDSQALMDLSTGRLYDRITSQSAAGTSVDFGLSYPVELAVLVV